MKNFYHSFKMWVGCGFISGEEECHMGKLMAFVGIILSSLLFVLTLMVNSSLSLLFLAVLSGSVAVLIFQVNTLLEKLSTLLLIILYQILGIGIAMICDDPAVTLSIVFNLAVLQYLLVKNLNPSWKATIAFPFIFAFFFLYGDGSSSSSMANASVFPQMGDLNISYIILMISNVGTLFILFKQQKAEKNIWLQKFAKPQFKHGNPPAERGALQRVEAEKYMLMEENNEQNDLLVQKEIELRKTMDELERTKEALKKAMLESEQIHEQVGLLMEEAHLNNEIFQAQEDVIKANIDIQKHTNEQVKEAINEHHKFSAMVENSSDLIALFDFEGDFLYVNVNGRKLLGVAPDISCTSQRISNFITKKQSSILKDEIPFELEKNGRWSGELVLVNQKDGSELTMDAAVFTVYDRHTYEPICYATVQRDITEKKRVAERISLLSLVASKTNNSVMITNCKGKIQWVNNSFTKITGYSLEEVMGKKPFEFLNASEKVRKDSWGLLRKLKSKDGFTTEMLNYRKSGETYWAEISVTPILNEYGQIEKYIALESDITHRKETEQKLKSTLSDLQSAQSQLVQSEKMASLGQLSAGIAHEINNPINFVFAGTETLKFSMEDFMQIMDKYCELDKTENTEAVLQEIKELKEEFEFGELKEDIFGLIEDIMIGAVRTSEIVKGLRNFSRLDEHNMKLANIHEGLDSTLILLKNQIKNKVQVHKKYGNIHELNCYPGQLNQVFMNILTNAIQAVETEGNIWISTYEQDQETLISIKDDGEGMSKEVVEKIFEPFFTTKDVGEGTGLGMSISYGIIQKHKGKIVVNSQEGKGSEFIIHLPLAISENA
ncbi:PAS domain S-box protein [Flammeovirgaceae bacterium SG7u.111]|nr:PAS domain S-box protein [Flammeovirgaceae bacterium SG7u.132]WPO35232.1 PAS domain S-box protein [Flammeovirgaceae bacterium SG7u.111]